MSIQVKSRRDTSSFLATFVGAQGELLVDTTNNLIQVHDGATAGGWLAHGKSPAPLVQAIDGSSVKHGGNIAMACQTELLSGLSGATKVSTITFPNPCLILGVSIRVTTAITGATSFAVARTTGGSAGEFGSSLGISLGTTNSGIIGPAGQYASVTVTLTAGGGNFTAGAVRIQLAYILLNPPTS